MLHEQMTITRFMPACTTNLKNSISSKDRSMDMSEVGDRDMEGVERVTSHTLGEVEVGSERSRL